MACLASVVIFLLLYSGCMSQNPEFQKAIELVFKQGQTINFTCDGTWTSHPDDLIKQLRKDTNRASVEKSGIYVCETNGIKTTYAVYVEDGDNCGLMVSNKIEDTLLDVMVDSNVTVPCVVFGNNIDVTLEVTRKCSDNLNSMEVEYIVDKGFKLKKVQAELHGEVVCLAQRYHCKQTRTFNLNVNVPAVETVNSTSIHPSRASDNKILVIGIVIASLILIGWIFGLVVWAIKKKRRVARLSKNDVRVFLEGAVETINPELGLDQQADLLPYDTRYEFPREHLRLGKQLGSGEFGRVVKAQARGPLYGAGPQVPGQSPLTTVAVKLLRPQAELAHLKALMTELKILIHVGKHLNVVSLLGACTANLRNYGLLVIVEYCRFGNLHSFLIRGRDSFIDQLDNEKDVFDFSIGDANEDDTSSLDGRVDFRLSPETGEVALTEEEAAIALYDLGPNCTVTAAQQEEPVQRTSTFELLETKQHGDFRAAEAWQISSKDLVCWAYQVARGMEYLSSKQVVHADLAARNLLLAENNVIKICDFGLSRNLYRHTNYQKKSAGPLPVRWLALESLQDNIYSTRSDIWSFGIVLWEFFSLARTPYPGIPHDESFVTRIREGYRMEKPEHSTTEIYEIMQRCWEASPASRPDFPDLAKQFGEMLEEKSKKLYLELLTTWTEEAELMDEPLVESLEKRKSNYKLLEKPTS